MFLLHYLILRSHVTQGTSYTRHKFSRHLLFPANLFVIDFADAHGGGTSSYPDFEEVLNKIIDLN